MGLIDDIRAGVRWTEAQKAERCQSLAELNGFLDGYALTKREPPRDVIEAIARRRAELKTHGRRN